MRLSHFEKAVWLVTALGWVLVQIGKKVMIGYLLLIVLQKSLLKNEWRIEGDIVRSLLMNVTLLLWVKD